MDEHVDRFPRPKWGDLWASLEPLPSDEAREATWLRYAHDWLSQVAAALGPDYSVHESGPFWIVSNNAAPDVQRAGRWLQIARKRIHEHLEGISADPLFSRLAVLWIEDQPRYYDYVSHYYPQSGEFALSGGMFLPAGYPHFVFPHYEEMWQLEHVIAHELTHALVSHLPLPLWLNEGMAVTLEEMVCAGNVFRPDPGVLEEHRAFWDAEKIQQFWSGESFVRTDDGNRLSYSLGQILVVNFGHDYPKYRDFCLESHCEDAGEAAARKVFAIGLGDLVGEILGPGDWTPRPAAWESRRDLPA